MRVTNIRTIASLFTVATVAGVIALAIPANSAETATARYITVTGVGTVSVVPDAVRFNATVSIISATNSAALSAATKSAAAVRTALKTAGIAVKDIRSASISVYPEYNWTQEGGTKITGYRASQSFDVLVRTASKAGSRLKMTRAPSTDCNPTPPVPESSIPFRSSRAAGDSIGVATGKGRRAATRR